MALAGLAVCGETSNSGKFEFDIVLDITTTKNCARNRKTGMELESESTILRKSSTHAAQVLRTATSFMPWSWKIPINEEYRMPGLISKENKITKSNTMCFTELVQQNSPARSKSSPCLYNRITDDQHSAIMPGLPDDVAKYCLALVPRSDLPIMGSVSKRWRSYIKSNEFITVRTLAGTIEEWLYVLTLNGEGKMTHWEALDRFGNKQLLLPPMPGLVKTGFAVTVLNGKLLVLGGYSMIDGAGVVSSDAYQYDSCLNSWSKLANMNVSRYDFACAEVNGMVYAVGGYGMDGEYLSSAEVYNPESDKWTVIDSLRRPRWGCFACGFEGKLYVMGGRSSFTIGNSRFVDVYDPQRGTWREMKNGCVMVTAHAVVGKKLFCMEWKNQRKLAIFDPMDSSWKMVSVPVTGSQKVGFQFGIMEEKLLLFAFEEGTGSTTLLYDLNATPGSEWQTSEIKPSGMCSCSVTIKA